MSNCDVVAGRSLIHLAPSRPRMPSRIGIKRKSTSLRLNTIQELRG